MPSLDAAARRVLGPAYGPVKLNWSTAVGVRAWRSSPQRPLTERAARHLGGLVQRGPFAGLRYPRHVQPFAPRLPGKLLAQYEAELAPTFARLLDEGFDTFVDIGCSEGFYATGFALKSPRTKVHAFDVDPLSRRMCRWLARANGVAERVEVGATCMHGDLRRLLATGRACLLSDCEGCELELLDPAAVPELQRCTIVVELHEEEHPGLTDTVFGRFRATHEIEVVDSAPRDRASADRLLEGLGADRAEVDELLFERPHPMQWAVLTPRA